jgi:O-antigen ligase
VTSLGADIGASGDQLRIPFRGTRLDLRVRRGDYRAFLYVTVDGEPGNALPLDGDGRAYVVLYDPLLQEDTVTVARDLDDGEHVAEITADRGWDQWAIVGWAVLRERPVGSLWLPIGLAFSAVVILAATCAWSWLRRDSLVDAVSPLVSGYCGLDDRIVLAVTAGIALLVYAMVGTVPTLAALAVLAALLVLRPEMGLPLIALALPFYQLGRPLVGKVFSMVEILTLLTAVGWVMGWSLRRWGTALGKSGTSEMGVAASGTVQSAERGVQHAVTRLTALDWGVLALVAVGALSLLWAEHGRVAAREFRTVILEAAVFYGLIRAMVRDRRDVWRLADAWVLGGVLIALVALFQWVFGQNLISAEGVWRVRGFYGSPNNLALYLGKVFPVTVAVAAWGQRGQRRWGYGLASLVMAIAILLTYSRGAWVVGVPAALMFLAVVRGWRAVPRSRRATVIAVSLLVVLVVGLLLVFGGGRLAALLDTTTGTTFFRLQLWRSSLAMVRDHPVLGVGPDNFLYAYRTHYVLPTAWEEFNLSHPHNVVLDFWLRLGLPGLLVLFWLLGAFFHRGWRGYKLLPEGGRRALMLGTIAGMVNLLAHGLVDNAFFLVDLAFTFMLMLALVQAKAFEARAQEL